MTNRPAEAIRLYLSPGSLGSPDEHAASDAGALHAAATDARTGAPDVNPGETVHVLLVDDDVDLLETVAATLRRHDDVIVTAESSVADALDTFDESFVDCVVSDYEMPRMDGLDFLTAVRWHSPDVPFIVMTAHGDEEVAGEAIRSGATDYIIKADDWFDDLHDHVRSAVTAREEGKLAHGTSRFRRAIEAIEGYAVFMTDANGRVLTWNSGGTTLTGRDSAAVVGERFHSLFADPGTAEDLLYAAAEDGEAERDCDLHHESGREIPAHALLSRVDGDFADPTYYTAVLRGR